MAPTPVCKTRLFGGFGCFVLSLSDGTRQMPQVLSTSSTIRLCLEYRRGQIPQKQDSAKGKVDGGERPAFSPTIMMSFFWNFLFSCFSAVCEYETDASSTTKDRRVERDSTEIHAKDERTMSQGMSVNQDSVRVLHQQSRVLR